MKFHYNIDQQFNEKHADEYIAIAYRVVYTDKQRGFYEVDRRNKQVVFISATDNKRANTISYKKLELPNEGWKILPLLKQNIPGSKNISRDVAVIYGSSGSGKSHLTTSLAKVYKSLNPKNKIVYVSSKNMEIDPTFNKELYTFVSFQDFMGYFKDEENYNNFEASKVFNKAKKSLTKRKSRAWSKDGFLDNTLLILDDLVMEDKQTKDYFFNKVLHTIITLKRMNYLTLIYCVHEMSDYKYTRTLFNESSLYISFSGDLKNRSSLVLKNYYKLSKGEVSVVTNARSRWSCINTKNKCVVTENEIIALSD